VFLAPDVFYLYSNPSTGGTGLSVHTIGMPLGLRLLLKRDVAGAPLAADLLEEAHAIRAAEPARAGVCPVEPPDPPSRSSSGLWLLVPKTDHVGVCRRSCVRGVSRMCTSKNRRPSKADPRVLPAGPLASFVVALASVTGAITQPRGPPPPDVAVCRCGPTPSKTLLTSALTRPFVVGDDADAHACV